MESKFEKFENFAFLKLYVNSSNEELIELYKEHVSNHNSHLFNDPLPNSGFDVFIPERTVIESVWESKLIDLEIKAEMVYNNKKSCPFFIFPRSSIYKTPLMLSNHTGIIDVSYRGFLMGAFRSLDNFSPYAIEKHTRLLQICHSSLCPIYVLLVKEDELSKTIRGEGGFGSTGLVGATTQGGVADVAETRNSEVDKGDERV